MASDSTSSIAELTTTIANKLSTFGYIDNQESSGLNNREVVLFLMLAIFGVVFTISVAVSLFKCPRFKRHIGSLERASTIKANLERNESMGDMLKAAEAGAGQSNKQEQATNPYPKTFESDETEITRI